MARVESYLGRVKGYSCRDVGPAPPLGDGERWFMISSWGMKVVASLHGNRGEKGLLGV